LHDGSVSCSIYKRGTKGRITTDSNRINNRMTNSISIQKQIGIGIVAFVVFALSLFFVLSAARVHAALTAGPDIIPAPLSIVDDAPGAENDHQQAFDEAQGIVLAAAVQCDNNTSVPAGTTVDSHMIFLNTEGSAFASDTQVWTFDGAVLCVMSDGTGSLEVASTPVLGAVGTAYPAAPFAARGMEGNDSYAVAANTITVTMQVTEPGDWIRVVTEHVDKTPPVVACVETVNPSGKNVPTAPANGGQGQNQDGFYKIIGEDEEGLQVSVVDMGADNVYGTPDDTVFPVSLGDDIKYTEANGATPSQRAMNGAVDWKINGQGDAAVVAVDAAGNVAVSQCLVPNFPQ
jgi:hypothetical protein